MLEFYIRRLIYKVACWFIIGRENRVKFGSKMGFGKKIVLLNEVDSYVPKEVLAKLESPLNFLKEYKTMLNPTPLDKIIKSSTTPPPFRRITKNGKRGK